jgi:osmotically inducible lipoprotein OsmB
MGMPVGLMRHVICTPQFSSITLSRRFSGPKDGDIIQMYLMRLIALVLSLLMMVAIVGCSGEPMSTREESTLLGGAAGLGGGALVGSALGAPGAGAAIGGVAGAAAGYGIGNHLQNEQEQHYYGGGYY